MPAMGLQFLRFLLSNFPYWKP